MQIHELNPFQGTLGSEAFLVVDNGDDTGKISVERLTQPINDRIDDIITSPAPTEQEIIDARRGWNEVVYGSLGTAIRSQVKQILAQFYKFNTYDLLAVYGTPISRTRNGVTFTWDDAGQVCEVSGEAVGGDAYASIYTQTGAWPGIFEHGVVYTIGYETTDPNVKLRIAVWEGVETTPDYYYFDEDGHFGIPPEAAKIGIDLYVASGDTVSAVVKNVYMLRTYTAKEVTATIRDAMIGADRHMYNSLGDAIREQLNGKVDKVTGKVLSSNDFTDADKTKLDNIEAGSEVNAIEAIKLGGLPLTPDGNRAVDIPVDDTLSHSRQPADANRTGYELSKKVDKEEGKGLSTNDFTDAYIDAIEDLQENKLAIDGYSELATVGNAEQLVATQHITDTEPYIYRKTGGPNDVGDRVYDTLVGGSVVWNQLIENGNFADSTNWAPYSTTYSALSVADNTATLTYKTAGSANYNYGMRYTKGLSLSTSHKYLISAYAKASFSGYAQFEITNKSLSPSKALVSGSWVNVAHVFEPNSNNQPLLIKPVSATVAVDDTFNVKNVQIIDLTAALTPTIADYIYTLETANAGDGVAWFKKYFPGIYYGYAEPHFEHVQTSAKETIGFNQWDEEWELGNIYTSNGQNGEGTDRIRSKNYIPVFPNTTYYFLLGGSEWRIFYYDADKNYLTYENSHTDSQTVTTINNAHYIRFWKIGTTYNHDICINLHGDRDGEYEPYRKRTYPLDSSLTLRGIPKLDSANRLYFDGDVYRHDGTVSRRIGESSYNGSETITVNQAANFRYFTIGDATPGVRWDETVRSNLFPSVSETSTGRRVQIDGFYKLRLIVDLDDALATVADVQAFLSSHNLVINYNLATPTTETAEPFQSPMVVDPLGTEEFVDYGVTEGDRDVAIPVGHTSEYPADLRGKLQHLPSLSTSGDGRYVVVQTGNQMTLSPDTSLGLIAALEARVAALEGGNG